MNDIIQLKETFTSLELVEQINIFRKKEYELKKEKGLLTDAEVKRGHFVELQHKDFLKILRNEFEEEITEGKISLSEYKDSTGRLLPYYILNLNQSKQILIRESKFVRKAILEYIDKLEEIIKNNMPKQYIPSKEQIQISLLEAKNKQAEILDSIANRCPNNKIFRQIIDSKIVELITGQNLLPLPEVEKTYSASDIAKMFNTNSKVVGKLANNNHLKTDIYSIIVHDKSPYSNKEIETYRYKKNSLDIFKTLIEGYKKARGIK